MAVWLRPFSKLSGEVLFPTATIIPPYGICQVKTEPALPELFPSSRRDGEKTGPATGNAILFSPTPMATNWISSLMRPDRQTTLIFRVEYRGEHLTGTRKGSIDGYLWVVSAPSGW